MNELLYNKIMDKISKVVKKSINEAYEGIYDKIYDSFNDLSILNNSGLTGDILQINDFEGFRVLPKKSVNESSLFNDTDFFSSELNITDEIILWHDFAICIEPGLWVYLDWIGLNKRFKWANNDTPLYTTNVKDFYNGYENTLYILNNFDVTDTLWDEVLKCKYPVFIPSIDELEKIREQRKLIPCINISHWSSSLYVTNTDYTLSALCFGFGSGSRFYLIKTNEKCTVALLHF